MISENKGNLIVSVGISVPQRGLTFYILDPRTHREAYRLVSFFDACTLLSDKTLESLENDLGNMDESVAYDLADEFAGLIEITNEDDEKLVMVLSGEETEVHHLWILFKISVCHCFLVVMVYIFTIFFSVFVFLQVENIVLARLGEFQAPAVEARSMKKASIPVQKVTIYVHGAKELERIGAFGTR